LGGVLFLALIAGMALTRDNFALDVGRRLRPAYALAALGFERATRRPLIRLPLRGRQLLVTPLRLTTLRAHFDHFPSYQQLERLASLLSEFVFAFLSLAAGLVFLGLTLSNSPWHSLVATGVFTASTAVLFWFIQQRPMPRSRGYEHRAPVEDASELGSEAQSKNSTVAQTIASSPVLGSQEESVVLVRWASDGWEVCFGRERKQFARQWAAEQWGRQFAHGSRPSRFIVQNKKGLVTLDYAFRLVDGRRKVVRPVEDNI
jgi:hypothetical protein